MAIHLVFLQTAAIVLQKITINGKYLSMPLSTPG
jgi:hypothetical protein